MGHIVARLRRQPWIAGGVGALLVMLALALAVDHGSGASANSPAAVHLPRTGGTPAAAPSATPAATATAAPTPTPVPATPAAAGHGQATSGPSNWFTASLGSACVIPGGTQTLDAQSRPGYTVAYNSHYADGSMGSSNGGFGVLATDANGQASTRWTVAASAPLGTVTVSVGTSNGAAPTTLARSFVVAAHC